VKLENDALTFAEVERWFARADTLAADGSVDLSGVRHVDSAGVALLLELARRARARGARLQLLAPPEQLRGLLVFFGLADIFDIHAQQRRA
jgi:phospholipid transport system transporter-binding protein